VDSIHDHKSSGEPGAQVILDVAINGIRNREMNPHLPQTLQEISAEAIACIDAGASIIHAHNTNPGLTAEAAAQEYMAICQPLLQKRPDALWYPTLVMEPNSERTGVEHVAILARECNLEMGPLDPGSVNVGTHLVNGAPTGMLHGVEPERVRRQFECYRDTGVASAIGIYEPGYLRTALAFFKAGLMLPGSLLNFYFIDDYGLLATEPACSCGLPPEPKYLDVYLSLMEGYDIPWSISIWGRNDGKSTELVEYALERGGHIQLGLETYYHPEKHPTNVELISEITALAKRAGRSVATPTQARQILGMKH
jgi:uncharacterized protein (DUF849 family)